MSLGLSFLFIGCSNVKDSSPNIHVIFICTLNTLIISRVNAEVDDDFGKILTSLAVMRILIEGAPFDGHVGDIGLEEDLSLVVKIYKVCD